MANLHFPKSRVQQANVPPLLKVFSLFGNFFAPIGDPQIAKALLAVATRRAEKF